MMVNDKTLLIGAGLLLGGLAVFVVASGGIKGAARSITGGVVSAADGAIAGTVEGVGSVLGVPLTDEARGRAAAASGDWWNASLYLPAPLFLHWAMTGAVD